MASLVERKRKVVGFSGPVVAAISIFDDKTGLVPTSVDHLTEYVKYLVSIGVKGFYVHGTTGEGVGLNHEEKKRLTKNWCQAVKKVAPGSLLVINVSSCCINDSQDLAALSATLPEVDAIAVLPPFYHRPRDVTDLVKYLKAVSSAAPSLPIMYYNFPEMTNVTFSMVDFVSAAIDQVPNFVGLKFTSKNMAELAHVQRKFGNEIKVFAGYEEVSLLMFY